MNRSNSIVVKLSRTVHCCACLVSELIMVPCPKSSVRIELSPPPPLKTLSHHTALCPSCLLWMLTLLTLGLYCSPPSSLPFSVTHFLLPSLAHSFPPYLALIPSLILSLLPSSSFFISLLSLTPLLHISVVISFLYPLLSLSFFTSLQNFRCPPFLIWFPLSLSIYLSLIYSRTSLSLSLVFYTAYPLAKNV